MDVSLKFNQEVGQRIREARLARDLSQQELAAKANLSLPHISDIENGKKAMKLATFVKIIEALQISADSILRADVPEVNQLYQNEFSQLVDGCTPSEIEALKKVVLQVKQAMRNE